MRIKEPHTPYISRKISLDLLNSKMVTINGGTERIEQIATQILNADIAKERALEERVNELLAQNESEMDERNIDRKSMFWLVKKKLADEYDVTLSYDDRYSNVSREILETLWKKGVIDYNVSENKIKNIIYSSIEAYIKSYDDVENEVLKKIENYKKKLIPGTDEYDLVFEKLYKEELSKKGFY
ncbi:DUF507 family protein [Campylobacter sp. RM12327]|uniref:DUF507 family protein n=1 Tax=Campylobacter sputorum TaxID=206 RepID=UPI00053BFCD6|nr:MULTISPECIES: DUF507 family protein [Campylobacter]ASM39386.1 DUF507 domain protein [Campylobacter sputorum]MBE7358280.1 DUF507 family protein [Campylobacter sp. RM11302]MBF6669572.1 DUF507 family protein [Campylobacter sp. RM12327]MBF6674281.1 DUF507 family protein [Campylobacter sp. RM13538]MBF6676065.1 DUF507 family protein [Campylobacter sp. RM12321]